MKLYFSVTSCIKSNSKWIKDLTLRATAIKLLEENIDSGFDNDCVYGIESSQQKKK